MCVLYGLFCVTCLLCVLAFWRSCFAFSLILFIATCSWLTCVLFNHMVALHVNKLQLLTDTLDAVPHPPIPLTSSLNRKYTLRVSVMGKITLQMIWDQNQDHTVKSDLKIKIKIKITSVISNQNHIFARKIRSKSRSLFSSPPFPRFVLKFHFASAIFSCP